MNAFLVMIKTCAFSACLAQEKYLNLQHVDLIITALGSLNTLDIVGTWPKWLRSDALMGSLSLKLVSRFRNRMK